MLNLLKISDPRKKTESTEMPKNKYYTDSDITIGIDFGTTNSLGCVVIDNAVYLATELGSSILVPECNQLYNLNNAENTKKLTPITNTDYNDAIIPSAIAINKDGICAVGRKALILSSSNKHVVVKSVKRLIMLEGLEENVRFAKETFLKALSSNNTNAKYIVCNKTNLPSIELFGKKFTCLELTTEIFKYIKHVCEESFCSLDIDNVKNCIVTVPAHFNDNQRRIVKKSAQLAGLSVKRMVNEPTAAGLAYNIDETKLSQFYLVYDLGGGTFDASLVRFNNGLLQVVATKGNSFLGGDDFDQLLSKLVLNKMPTIKTSDSLEIAKKIKHHFSNYQNYKLPNGDIITVSNYNDIIKPLIEKTFDIINKDLIEFVKYESQALFSSSDEEVQLVGVILVGGSTKNNIVQHLVKKNYPCPILRQINPDIAVVIGAAVQGAIIDKRLKDRVLIDITPFSIGIETIDGLVEKIINRNTSVPISVYETFTTSQDNQTGIDINVYRGERGLVKYSTLLGKFTLKGIPPMIAGQPILRINFTLDADGILSVSATEERSSVNNSIIINPVYNINIKSVKEECLLAIEKKREDASKKMYLQAISESSILLVHTNRILKKMLNSEEWGKNLQEVINVKNQLEQALSNKDIFSVITELYWKMEKIMTPVLENYLKMQLTISNKISKGKKTDPS
ncbi:MAG: Hsp70 family protein [Alphaproteobacteria bacterium]|nr:Hsp70 family protein [Rickettsiales bacterium]